MTLPDERHNAIRRTIDFLASLLSPYSGVKGIPKEVRQEARYLLKHFPAKYQLEEISKCKKCSKIIGPLLENEKSSKD